MIKKKESSKGPSKKSTTLKKPKKSLTLSATQTDSTTKKSLEKTERRPEKPKKQILAPFPGLDLVTHTPTTGRCWRIIAQIFCFVFSVVVMMCILPIFESVLFPEHFFSRFDSLIWDKQPKTEMIGQVTQLLPLNLPLLFLDVDLRYDNIIFNLKFYSKIRSLEKINDVDQIFLCVDTGKIELSFDHFVLCRPFPDKKPSFRKYVQVMKLCYQYIRQIAWNAQIIGYGHKLGGNILVRAANELWQESCYSFFRIIMIEPKVRIQDELKDALFYFQFAVIIEENMMKEMQFTANGFVEDAMHSSRVKVIHVTENENDKVVFEALFGTNHIHERTITNALMHVTPTNEKWPYKPQEAVFARYEEENKCLMKKNAMSFF